MARNSENSLMFALGELRQIETERNHEAKAAADERAQLLEELRRERERTRARTDELDAARHEARVSAREKAEAQAVADAALRRHDELVARLADLELAAERAQLASTYAVPDAVAPRRTIVAAVLASIATGAAALALGLGLHRAPPPAVIAPPPAPSVVAVPIPLFTAAPVAPTPPRPERRPNPPRPQPAPSATTHMQTMEACAGDPLCGMDVKTR